MMETMVVEGWRADAPAWTLGRVAKWIGLTLILLFVAGVAAGFTAAWLDAGTGARVWSGRISATAPLIALLVFGGVGWAALRRNWPTTRPGSDEWQRRAATRARRTWGAWIGTVATLAVAGMLVPFAAWLGIGTAAGLALMIAAVALAVIGGLWGTLVYMKVIDEQERQANLWSGYAGLTTYFVLFFAELLIRKVVPGLPALDGAVFAAVSAVTLGTFLVKRFR